MTTADGISTVDWDAVHRLTLHIVNATSIDERATARSRLFAFLDQLESKHGALPSILATRADSSTMVSNCNYFRSLPLAAIRADHTNLLCAHSLASFTSTNVGTSFELRNGLN
jgi:hypothetical protein